MNWSNIHSAIQAVSKKKFEDGHLADSVESAFKEVNTRVKDHVQVKTGIEKDGADAMTFAFSLKQPVIRLADLATDTGRNIQQGYMQIFAGAMTGIRNPKAHRNLAIEESRAEHFLYLASLLMHKLDEAGVPVRNCPEGFRHLVWGNPAPKSGLKMVADNDGVQMFIPDPPSIPEPLFGIPIAEESFSFSYGRFYKGDLWFDGKANFKRMRAALTEHYGPAQEFLPKVSLWKWKWTEDDVEVRLYYNKTRSTLTLLNTSL